MSINRVMVSGNLTRDPELRQAGASQVCQFGIAVNDRKKNNQTGEWEDVPNYFDVVVWAGRGEYLSRTLSKGMKVAITGRLRWSSWQTPEGQNRSKVEIVADEVEFFAPRGESPAANYAPAAMPDPSAVEVLSEDIPF